MTGLFFKFSILFGFLVAFINISFAQNAILPTGGSDSTKGGSITFSIGQTADSAYSNQNANISEGVQQPYELVHLTGKTNNGKSKVEFEVFPNPTSGKLRLRIDNKQKQEFKIELLKLNGQVLLSHFTSQEQFLIDFRKRDAGVYLLNIYQNNERKDVYKIIKQ